MSFDAALLHGFLDELEKIGASRDQLEVHKVRTGTRPISVDNLVRKHNEGTLLKKADAAGNPQDVRGASSDDPNAAKASRRPGDVPTKDPGNIPENEKLGFMGPPGGTSSSPVPAGESPYSFQEAKKPRRKGDVPSRDDSNVVDRFDARESATTVSGLAQNSSNIGAFNNPAEHS